jgi:crossover junction endodeoxyribonuclease RuvC
LVRERLVLGIDPGTAIMGYGLVAARGDELRPIDFGVLTTTADQPLAERLRILYEGLTDLIRRFDPTEVAVEKLFFSRNVTTALAVGQARGVALVAAANCGLTVSEYSPQQVKQAVAVYGKATKDQIQHMVRVLLGLAEIPWPDDAADALAIAICHLYTSDAAELIRRQT